VGEADEEMKVSELRDHLRAKLPEYMVPSAFVPLQELPLTVNGKVDRRALPEPEADESGYVAPRTAVEEMIAGIWESLLPVERVGIHDNFFDLGGHSLLATQVASRVREAFQVEVPLRRIFECPTVFSLAEWISHTRQAGKGKEVLPLAPVSRTGLLPLSFAQERLWFIDQLAPQQPVYNLPLSFYLKGALDVAALQQSLNEIVRRHESLRVSFRVVEGRPVQVIAPVLRLELPVTELQDEAEVRGLAKAEAQQPFDLAQGPLLRGRVLRLSEAEHVLLLTMHHIVSDGWSMGVVYQELTTLYAAYSQGQASPLRELSLQYVDFAVWQREWLSGAVLEAQLSYWKEQLQGAPAVLELPSDRARPQLESHRGGSLRFKLSEAVSEKLRALSRNEDATLFMTLLAAFQTLLYRYSGQEDIVVGTPIANRNRGEIEGLIGFFVNTLAMRTKLSGGQSFRELLGRVREVCLGAYENQDVPFEKLVEELQPERSLSHHPVFQVMFVLQNAPVRELKFAELDIMPFNVTHERATFDLTLSMVENKRVIQGIFEYSAELFDVETMRWLAEHFERLLESIVANPEARLAELQLLSEAEREQLLYEWNDTTTAYPAQCIVELFEAQVERTPEAIALAFGEQRLSYAELNQRANQLGHYLRGKGVRAEVLVGICMERSLEMVVGVLGILKAGGAYVPLDTSYPRERLSFMLQDAGVKVLLTQERLAGEFAGSGVEVMCLDTAAAELAQHSVANPAVQVSAENLAYVIYTSGSTGAPKGVSVTQRAVVRLVRETNYVQLGTEDRVAQLSNPAFDAVTFEIWGALLNGGRLVGIAKEVALTPAELASRLREEKISALFMTAALFNQVVREVPDAFAGVKHTLVGGEALDPKWMRTALEQGRPPRLLNGYGPTEGTTFSAWFEIEQVAADAASIPIGKALSNTQLYVLDERLQPVPVGVRGELYIGGDGLARGYLQRPELTAERFVPHPFSRTPGERLYRTGDIVRYLHDGAVDLIGRADDQVKLRGFRIELGEIETVLSGHAAVRECVVVVRGESEAKRLVAYVVGEADEEMKVSELRDHLRAKLPEYMVPSAFVVLEELPLTVNGKVDRRALPEPAAESVEGYVAPRTAVEEMIAGIWESLLPVERVGIHDNFFDLGGHSLLATQVASRVREAFQVEVPLRTFFECPTVAALTLAIVRSLVEQEDRAEVVRLVEELEHTPDRADAAQIG
jgi:amino acid adenylation domain-containing protein